MVTMAQNNNTPGTAFQLFKEWENIKVDKSKSDAPKPEKVYENKMYSIIYRLRKYNINIDTPGRTIYYTDAESIDRKGVRRLCSEFGFVRQSQFE